MEISGKYYPLVELTVIAFMQEHYVTPVISISSFISVSIAVVTKKS